jgi:hypothetical protein
MSSGVVMPQIFEAGFLLQLFSFQLQLLNPSGVGCNRVAKEMFVCINKNVNKSCHISYFIIYINSDLT